MTTESKLELLKGAQDRN